MKTRIGLWLLIALGTSMLMGCGSKPPHRKFTDAELLIDESVMPEGWALAEYSDEALTNEGQESGAYISFYAVDTSFFVRSGEDIYRYSNTSKAAWHYSRLEADYFSDTSAYRTTPWEMPTGFTFSSPFAERWRFACAGSSFTFEPDGPDIGKTHKVCIYLAQYNEFIVYFSATTEIDGQTFITIDELVPVIEAVDRRMGEHLNPTPSP